MTTNLKQRFEEKFLLGVENTSSSHQFKEEIRDRLPKEILAFIKQELELLAEECEAESKKSGRNITWAGLVDAAAIIRNRANEI